ncbi:type II toxin-antitoxin system ParD family antitoxin [Ciceribacter sp. L1K23]|uniref:ribbon-helix-helix domain-containing protein n=1 Tax=Ciceribacter sp. L1K23 TaxID=2820276 RepID=UPI001B82D48A|nr:type II toxin-antitoxin system ParD family antitoxin [Ciceribacter sp. L1K23]MBR0555356.1 type II toxin-antitoxin system ParD family antitoxin [Ciceribacter sp. L1K23]
MGAETIRVALSDEMRDIVEDALSSGDFKSAEDVVSAALTQWQAERLLANFTPEELDVLIQEGLDSGDPIDGEEAFRRIEEDLERYIASKRA